LGVLTLALIGFVGGLLAGVSPCILPVLPVIFLSGGTRGAGGARVPGARVSGARSGDAQVSAARSGDARVSAARSGDARVSPARRVRAPVAVVAGLTLSFSLVTLFGALLLRALPLPDDVIRWAGLVVLVLLGIAMMVPRFEELLQRPFARIPQRRPGERGGFVLGLALGAVFVPCAGPVLAAITVAGATGRIGVRTVVLTVAFAIGTAIPLLMFAMAGQQLAQRLRAFRRHQRGVRAVAGGVVILLALALTFNLTDPLQRLVPDYTAAGNNALNKGLSVGTGALADCAHYSGSAKLQDCGPAPQISGITQWLNSPPLTMASLKGSVVLVDFWAYSCINCQRAIGHVTAWYDAYKGSGLQVIGVHTPEYAFEKEPGNVAAGAQRLGITYPVALDNAYTTWDNYSNDSWPADYLIDATGTVRYAYIGEGDYPGTESLIRDLLSAARPGIDLPAKTQVPDTTPTSTTQTPEAYLGSGRANSYVGATPLAPGTATFSYPPSIPDDQFALTGTWQVSEESLTAVAGAGITVNYDASDIYLDVGGTGTITATVDGKTTAYQVSGAPNIYTVLHRASEERGILKLTLSPGLNAYSFTFG
jgi:cytochrome c biogenesis protein CcdA/thiol-disulfide isomerase/thioredoxin